MNREYHQWHSPSLGRKMELLFVGRKNNAGTLTVTGCSFGGYHAMNLALRHPDKVNACISLGGAFDIKQFVAGYYDSDCYFNSPVDYLPNLTDRWSLDLYRARVSFVLATGEQDICLSDNVRLARMLEEKGVPRVLDVWGDGTGHDWPWGRRMIAKFVQ